MSKATLQDRLLQYLSDQTSLRGFEEWFMPAMASIMDEEDSGVTRLASDVQLLLAELSEGLHTESGFREAAMSLLWETVSLASFDPPTLPSWTTSGSSDAFDSEGELTYRTMEPQASAAN